MSSSQPRSLARRKFRGMTLLELVLSLSLSALLLMAVSMALHIHWKAFDVKRSRVEEAQLASAILRNISDDIRGALKFESPNLEGLNLKSLASNVVGKPPEDGPLPKDNEDQKSPPEQQPSNPSQDPTPEVEMATESGPSVVVGLYGSATQLQFDISRLPRVDQYQSLETDDGSVQIPCDIKTVVYFLRADDSAEPTTGFSTDAAKLGSAQPSSTGTGRGLMRAQSDRAVSAYGEVNGSTDSIYGGAKLLAAEVTSLQFQYFDGTQWLTEWNSDDEGGLPTAIEVLLTIDTQQSGTSATAGDASGQREFRMVVQLPVGGISPSTEESTASGMTGMGTPPEETMP